MYKDLEKRKQANRERQRRYKERQKALASEGVTITDKATPKIETIIPSAIPDIGMEPDVVSPILPANFGEADCECMMCDLMREYESLRNG